MTAIGVVHGRFQPFHNHHLRYCEAALQHCDHLIVGITNPDSTLTAADTADPHRSLEASNPLTYYERLVVIREGLEGSGINHKKFDIVPFPINFPQLLKQYAPVNATYYVTIYDAWGHRKAQVLGDIGLSVEILWEWDPADKGITGSDLRHRITEGLPWEHLVPSCSATVLRSMGLIEKIRFFAAKASLSTDGG